MGLSEEMIIYGLIREFGEKGRVRTEVISGLPNKWGKYGFAADYIFVLRKALVAPLRTNQTRKSLGITMTTASYPPMWQVKLVKVKASFGGGPPILASGSWLAQRPASATKKCLDAHRMV